MKQKAVMASLAVEGIQKYIFSTGKLKEMIGASEIIYQLGKEDFYKDLLGDVKVSDPEGFTCKAGECLVSRANAGSLTLIFGQADEASGFLERASRKILREYPGLPFYGACDEFDWSADQAGVEAWKACNERMEQKIDRERNLVPVADGCGLLPILQTARLDGLPVSGMDGETPVSLPSLARCNPDMIKKSRERLHKLVRLPDGVIPEWKDNLEEMLLGQSGKVALVCMDGNSMGKLFGERLNSNYESPAIAIREMKALSDQIERLNKEAFVWACEKLVGAIIDVPSYRDDRGRLVMPLRPIVMGGDDVTVICSAEVALAFVSLFAARLEKLGSQINPPLSIGAGMVVMSRNYPFVKAFPLAESLQDSAKNLTVGESPRPSSIDYLVLTEEVEDNLETLRSRLFRSKSGELLTTKPFILRDGQFTDFLKKGLQVNEGLPRSQIREAWTISRKGSKSAQRAWANLNENIARNLGGRAGKLLSLEVFKEIFPNNFFVETRDGQSMATPLGDYLELPHLLPANPQVMLALIQEAANND